MNISLDKFWDFIKQWSAGRLAVLILLIGELIVKLKKDAHFMEPEMLFKLISMAILLEVFENVFSKMKSDKKLFWIYLLAVILSLGAIVVIALSFILNFQIEMVPPVNPQDTIAQ
jgi:hypothetical protein